MAEHKIRDTYFIKSHEQATALLNPLRGEILSKMKEPVSAAEIARQINEIPQRINYHLKALEKAGLVHRVGTRQVKNLVEVLYQAIAKTFVISDTIGIDNDTIERIKDQSSLAHLIHTSDRIKRDTLQLLEQAEQGDDVASATLQKHVHLESKEKRNEFVNEYVNLVKTLVEKYQTNENNSDNVYNVTLTIYPKMDGGEGNE